MISLSKTGILIVFSVWMLSLAFFGLTTQNLAALFIGMIILVLSWVAVHLSERSSRAKELQRRIDETVSPVTHSADLDVEFGRLRRVSKYRPKRK